jgi:cyclohexanecarboxylate-CoA ligase
MIFTSGTSGRPKGVLYSHRGLAAEGREMAGLEGLDGEARLFVPPSIAHVSGICFGLYMPMAVGCGVFLLPDWSGDAALDTICHEGCTWTAGATPFLQAVVAAAEQRPETVRGLRVFRCGGASVPPGLIRRARALGLDAYRSYGMSEHPTISGRVGQPDEVCMRADGAVHPGVALRVLDLLDPSRVLPAGEAGEIAVRGPDHSLGYLRAADNESSLLDGWFLTGDIGWVSVDNVITITGRKKDIIIRKGENIAAKEIEDMVGENPAVSSVAVVGMPDAERGEMVCCVVVPRNGAVLGVADICAPLRRAGLATFKLPERVVCVDSLPCNANGKILKNQIKIMLETEHFRPAVLLTTLP